MGKGVPKHLRHLAVQPTLESELATGGKVDASTAEPLLDSSSVVPLPTLPDPPKAATPSPSPTFPTIIVSDEETLLEAMGY